MICEECGKQEVGFVGDSMCDDCFFAHEQEEEVNEDEAPIDPHNYAVVRFGVEYGILPLRSVKEHHEVMTKTIAISVAEAYLADLTDDDDDPVCVCGVYHSEHNLCGCEDGFQSAGSWAVQREWIGYQASQQDFSDYRYESMD